MMPRLVAFATKQVRQHRWHGHRRDTASEGKAPEDFVYDAILKTVSGVRVWNPKKTNIIGHLFGVIRSDIWALSQSAENRKSYESESLVEIIEANGHYFSPEQILHNSKIKEQIGSLLLSQNKMYFAIFNIMILDPITTPTEIAEELGCTVQTVYHARRRIKEIYRTIGNINAGDRM